MNNKNALAAVVAISVAALTGCASEEFISLAVYFDEQTNVAYTAAGHDLGEVSLNGVAPDDRTDVEPGAACITAGCAGTESGSWIVDATGDALFELEVDGAELVVDVDDGLTPRTATLLSADANGISMQRSHPGDTIVAASLMDLQTGVNVPATVDAGDDGIVTLAAEEVLPPGSYFVSWAITLHATCSGEAAPAECDLVTSPAPLVEFTVE